MMFPQKKKKKVDYEALNSSLMRIPRMDVAAARSLINVGVREIYDLKGRAPEILFEEARLKNEEIPSTRFAIFGWPCIMRSVRHPKYPKCIQANGTS